MDFDYVVSEKNGYIVVSLAGRLDESVLPKLSALHQQLENNEVSKRLVLNMQELAEFSKDVVRAFALLQKSVRDKKIEMRVCSLQPSVKDVLEKAGVLREREVMDNLQTALLSLAQK